MFVRFLSLITALVFVGGCVSYDLPLLQLVPPTYTELPTTSVPDSSAEGSADHSTQDVSNPSSSTNTPDISYEDSVPASLSFLLPSPASYDFSRPVPECPPVDNSYFADAAFVGDSRTEGFWLYSKIGQGKLISYTGLTVFGAVSADVININGRKGTVIEALSAGKYSKVYLSFGVNELGYRDTESFYRTYCKLVDSVRAVQPNAIIYIQTIFPVNNQRARATGHKSYVNCERIREFNEVIRRVANDKRIPLLDLYSAFAVDDQLPLEASRDGVHLVAEYCVKQLEFYRNHAIPTQAFTNREQTPVSPTQPTTPAGTPSQKPVAPAPATPVPVTPTEPEASVTPETPAVPETPAAPETPTVPESPAVSPVEPATPPASQTPAAPKTPSTDTKPEATV